MVSVNMNAQTQSAEDTDFHVACMTAEFSMQVLNSADVLVNLSVFWLQLTKCEQILVHVCLSDLV